MRNRTEHFTIINVLLFAPAWCWAATRKITCGTRLASCFFSSPWMERSDTFFATAVDSSLDCWATALQRIQVRQEHKISTRPRAVIVRRRTDCQWLTAVAVTALGSGPQLSSLRLSHRRRCCASSFSMNYTVDPTTFTDFWDFTLAQVYVTTVSTV
jgi:hypothetical protein